MPSVARCDTDPHLIHAELSTVELDKFLEDYDAREQERKRRENEDELTKIEEEAQRHAEQVRPAVDPNGMNLKIKFADGTLEKIRIKKTATVESIRAHLAKKRNLPIERVILKLDGEKVDDEDTVEGLDLEDDDMLDAQVK